MNELINFLWQLLIAVIQIILIGGLIVLSVTSVWKMFNRSK